MKTRRFATIILTAMLIATIFGSVTVLAPPPTTPIPPTLFETFITNTSDDPVPVTITGSSIDVNLDEPVEVEGTVQIDDSTPIAVEVTNPSVVDGANAFRPFQYSWNFEYDANTIGAGSGFYIPTGKVLVVEYITLMVYSPVSNPVIEDDSFVASVSCYYDTWESLADSFKIGQFEYNGMSKEVKIYAGPGTHFEIWLSRHLSGYRLGIKYTVSGYFIDAPSYENYRPVARCSSPFGFPPYYVNTPITIYDRGSVDFYPGTIVAYDWDFGDGTTGTGMNPTHTYTEAGTYIITLTVTDNEGATDTDTATIHIYG